MKKSWVKVSGPCELQNFNSKQVAADALKMLPAQKYSDVSDVSPQFSFAVVVFLCDEAKARFLGNSTGSTC